MYTILGAGGVIGQELSRELSSYSTSIRLVSRNPQKVNPTDETFAADLLDADATDKAIAGSKIVFLVVGLKYNYATWRDQWPRLMQNVINACKRHGCWLVFLDNVYAYGRVDGLMTEQTPFHPTSKKGEVRAEVATMLLDEISQGNLQAMITRSADFYGPGAVNSIIYSTVFARLKDGKTPQWICNPNVVHTFTYTPDIARALAVLGNSPDAYGQTWHLPTSKELFSVAEIVQLACELANQPYRLQILPGWLRKLLSLFIPVLHENEEMMYQFEYDYRFDSSKIEKAFGLQATTYREGIKATLQSLIPDRG